MAKRLVQQRIVRPTVLIVGEGYAEEALLRHIRATYTCDNQGCRMTIGNARGKGAGNVVEHTYRISRQAKYDQIAALLDTDTDWTPAVQRRARSVGLQVLPSTPCVEAWLLQIVGDVRQGSTQDYKQRFTQRFGGEAHLNGLIARHFSKALIDQARLQVRILDDLLRLLGV